MHEHILIATDGSDLARKAVVEGLNFAKAIGAQVTIATVTEPWATQMVGEAAIAFPYEVYNKTMAANASDILAGASDTARSANVPCSTVHVRERHAAEGILEAAKANNCDLIVMASHGRRGHHEAHAWQSDSEGGDAHRHSRIDLSLTGVVENNL